MFMQSQRVFWWYAKRKIRQIYRRSRGARRVWSGVLYVLVDVVFTLHFTRLWYASYMKRQRGFVDVLLNVVQTVLTGAMNCSLLQAVMMWMMHGFMVAGNTLHGQPMPDHEYCWIEYLSYIVLDAVTLFAFASLLWPDDAEYKKLLKITFEILVLVVIATLLVGLFIMGNDIQVVHAKTIMGLWMPILIISGLTIVAMYSVATIKTSHV